jgi:transcriptional regulator with XRE-family HTH domain
MEPSIRKKLERLMREHNLSQSALSRATGVPQPTINRILSQATLDLRRDSVVRIAQYFGVEPETLYEGDGQGEKQQLASRTPCNPSSSAVMDDICKRVMSLSRLQRAEILQRLVEMVVVK